MQGCDIRGGSSGGGNQPLLEQSLLDALHSSALHAIEQGEDRTRVLACLDVERAAIKPLLRSAPRAPVSDQDKVDCFLKLEGVPGAPPTVAVDAYGLVVCFDAPPHSPLYWHVDHVLAAANGGLTLPSNLAVVQWRLNLLKRDKIVHPLLDGPGLVAALPPGSYVTHVQLQPILEELRLQGLEASHESVWTLLRQRAPWSDAPPCAGSSDSACGKRVAAVDARRLGQRGRSLWSDEEQSLLLRAVAEAYAQSLRQAAGSELLDVSSTFVLVPAIDSMPGQVIPTATCSTGCNANLRVVWRAVADAVAQAGSGVRRTPEDCRGKWRRMHSAAPDDVNEDELSDGEGAAPRKYEPFESRLTENAARLLGTLGDALAQRRVPPAARSVPARLQWACREALGCDLHAAFERSGRDMRDKCRGMVFTAAQIALTTDVLARDSSLHPVWPLFAHRLPQLAATLLAPSHWRQLRCPEGCTDSVRERLWAFVVHPEGETRLLPRLERYRPDLLHGDGCVSRGSGNTASLASSNDCGGSGKGGTADTCAGNEGTSSNGEEAASGDGSRGTTLDSNGTAGCADDPTGSLSPPPTADFIDLTLTDSGDEAGGAAQGSARVTWHRLPLAPLQEHQRVQQGGQQQKLEDMHCPLEEQQQQQLQATSFGSTQRSGGRGGGQCKAGEAARRRVLEGVELFTTFMETSWERIVQWDADLPEPLLQDLKMIEIRSIGRKASSFKKKRLEQQRTAAAL